MGWGLSLEAPSSRCHHKSPVSSGSLRGSRYIQSCVTATTLKNVFVTAAARPVPTSQPPTSLGCPAAGGLPERRRAPHGAASPRRAADAPDGGLRGGAPGACRAGARGNSLCCQGLAWQPNARPGSCTPRGLGPEAGAVDSYEDSTVLRRALCPPLGMYEGEHLNT